MRKITIALIALGFVCVLSGCARKPSGTAIVKAPPTDPEEFLKWSMDRTASLKTFQAECDWKASYGAEEGAPGTTRVIHVVLPNRFKIVSSHGSGFAQTSVSDGKTLAEFASSKELPAMTYPAPANIADAQSMQMMHPMFCGSLLYKFFGGRAKIDALADKSKQALSFGADETILEEPCRTVRFYATGLYGKTEVAISTRDGLVRRIVYGSEPLVAQMQGMDAGGRQMPNTSRTVETYRKIVTDAQIADSMFDTTTPSGQSVTQMPQSGTDVPPIPIGQPAPDFTVKTLDGHPVTLSSMKGKVVLIDFWATWCGPCIKGLPETQKIHDELTSKGVAVMAVSSEDITTVTGFIKRNNYTFPAYVDEGGKANTLYKVDSIPRVVVIDREGRMQTYLVGLHPPEAIREALRKAGV